jgi:hypothetical protein
MIARVRFAGEDGPVEAVLGDGLRWTAPGVLGLALNALIDVEDRSPALGRWWIAHVAKVADTLGGVAEYETKEARPPGTIY